MALFVCLGEKDTISFQGTVLLAHVGEGFLSAFCESVCSAYAGEGCGNLFHRRSFQTMMTHRTSETTRMKIASAAQGFRFICRFLKSLDWA